MKLGKIYDYRNKEEAKKLIGKKVIVSDYLCNIEEVPVCNLNEPCTLMGIREDNQYPFSLKNDIVFQFIREIEEEDEPKRMTNRQLAEWIARGFGLYTFGYDDIYTFYTINIKRENKCVDDAIRIRCWGSDEWIVPTVDIYNRDCKGKVDDKAEI